MYRALLTPTTFRKNVHLRLIKILMKPHSFRKKVYRVFILLILWNVSDTCNTIVSFRFYCLEILKYKKNMKNYYSLMFRCKKMSSQNVLLNISGCRYFYRLKYFSYYIHTFKYIYLGIHLRNPSTNLGKSFRWGSSL